MLLSIQVEKIISGLWEGVTDSASQLQAHQTARDTCKRLRELIDTWADGRAMDVE